MTSPSLRLWAPVVVYMAAIFYVSSLSDPAIPSGTDKPLHSAAYLGLAVLVLRALAGGLPGRIDVWTAAVAMLITVGYAVTDEAHQMFVPGRSGEVYDLLADAAGALTGTVACWAWGIISSAPHPAARKTTRRGPRAPRDEL